MAFCDILYLPEYYKMKKKSCNFYAFAILLRYSTKNPKYCVHVVLKRKEMIMIINLISLFLCENHDIHKKKVTFEIMNNESNLEKKSLVSLS